MAKPMQNDPPMNEVMEPTNFDLEASVKRHLEQLAERSERSLSGMIRLILKQYLDGKDRT